MTQVWVNNLPDEALVECDSCGWHGRGAEVHMIDDAQDRLEPGGITPAGQCPEEECGALVYLYELPPDPEGMNWKRASWAEAGLDGFARATFQANSNAEPDEILSDLLCDLRHWADRQRLNWEFLISRAMRHYDEETLSEAEYHAETNGAPPRPRYKQGLAEVKGIDGEG